MPKSGAAGAPGLALAHSDMRPAIRASHFRPPRGPPGGCGGPRARPRKGVVLLRVRATAPGPARLCASRGAPMLRTPPARGGGGGLGEPQIEPLAGRREAIEFAIVASVRTNLALEETEVVGRRAAHLVRWSRRRLHRVGAEVVPTEVLEVVVLRNFIKLPRAREARLLVADKAYGAATPQAMAMRHVSDTGGCRGGKRPRPRRFARGPRACSRGACPT